MARTEMTWTEEEQTLLREIERKLEAKGIPSHRASYMAERELDQRIEREQRLKEFAS